MADKGTGKKHCRTLSYRAVLTGIVSMVVLAMWIHFHEVLCPSMSILAENSPPAGAVGVFMGVLLIAGAIWRLSPRLRLTAGELIVVYTMLVTSAPLMTQGMWHRFLGFVVAIPEEKGNLALVDSFSERLWPHGPHLVDDRRFAGPEGSEGAGWWVTPTGNAQAIDAPDSPMGRTTALELRNPDPGAEGEDPDTLLTTLTLRINRWKDGHEQLVPGERYYFNGLFRLSDMRSRSRLTAELVSDGGETVSILSATRDTPATFSDKGGFRRLGQPYVSLPRDVTDHIDLVFSLEGVGQAAVTDIAFFSNEALARLRKGSVETKVSDMPKIPDNQRDSLVVRPDNLATPAGLWYVLKGYVPYRQWLGPLLAWSSIVLAVFFCLLGISVVFRRQWADNERFSFPLVMLPRLLLEEEDQANGRRVRPLFGKRTFRAGVYLALIYCLLQGLAHYIPGMPDPTVNVPLGEYVASPAAKALVKGMAPTNFQIYLMFTAIAFFVDLEMLASILLCFWLCKIPYYFGEVFGWKAIKGPLDNFPFASEQHIGSFLGLALIALWIARKHLAAVGRTVLGRPGGLDDSGEAMRYRTAIAIMLLSLVFIGAWGALTGLGGGNALLFFGFLIVCGFSASRIRTECGAPATYFTPYHPFLVFFLLGGLQVFSTETMVLAYCAGGFMAVAQFLMFAPTQVEMLHLGNHFKAKPSGISWALVLGILGGVLLGGYVMLVWAYGKGGDNIPYMKRWAIHQDWYLSSLRQAVIETDGQSLAAMAQGKAVEAAYPGAALAAAGVGVGITVLLTFLRMHFVGFWLHPIGYVLANAHFSYMCWGSLLVAWAIKALALKIGGPRLIRDHMAPMMAGVFCGGLLGIFLWDVVAMVCMANGVRDAFSCFP